MKYVIIGGVAGGASAAARLKRIQEDAEIVILEKGEHISYANCGMPYYIGNTIEERKKLFVQTPVSFGNRYDADVRTLNEVTAIHRDRKTVAVRNLRNGKEYEEAYDILLLSPGAEPIIPPVPGTDLPNIFTLRNVSDCDRIKAAAAQSLCDGAEAVIIGGGFIGLEMAENLHKLGYRVTVVEKADHILTPLDWPMAAIVQQHLADKGVRVITGNGLAAFQQEGDALSVTLDDGTTLPCRLAILSIGVRPNTRLAEACGLKIGEARGIWVNEFLQTSDECIFAVGDAIEFPHPITGKPYCNFLAGPANLQARIAAMNMVYPQTVRYQGSVTTAIAKIFDLTAASTGLSEKMLKKHNIEYQTVIVHPAAHATYYPGGSQIHLKLNFHPQNGMILGAQAVGTQNVDKQIDAISLIMKHQGTIFDLVNSEHAYAPPYGSAKSPVMFAGMVAENIMAHLMNPIQAAELDELLDKKEDINLLDVREIQEFKTGTIEGAGNYPVDELREFLDDIEPDKKTVVFCEVGLRGYVASRILMQSGFEEVYNLIGGMKTYRLVGKHFVKKQ
ncbi:MAG: FAD-dependent oxidoreductase [Bacteroidales bacterium]|nr:FAD-dependent oxidoreductase [Bacteroidales bacterium]